MNPTPPIYFHFNERNVTLRHRTALKQFINSLIEKEGRLVENVNYIFCNDEQLLELNKQYLNHFTLTDIITFELSAKDEALLSDVFISVERVRENAKMFKIPFNHELHRVIFHGALHLCAYKDKTKADKLLMRQKEDFYLHQYFVSRKTVSP